VITRPGDRWRFPRGTGGFTLVELMVVLVITGLVATAVVLTAPASRDALTEQAETLATRLVRAREEAILSTRAVEVTVTSAGYGFARQSFGNWQPLRGGAFDNRLWPPGVAPVFEAGRERLVFRFDPTGIAAERALVLADAQTRMRIQVDGAGEVQVHGPE
jgi:general secretion pathway protein H